MLLYIYPCKINLLQNTNALKIITYIFIIKDSSGKTTKRTPSFNTRRRTQSFRKQKGDPSDLPPVEIEGTENVKIK